MYGKAAHPGIGGRLHGGGVVKDSLQYPELAEAIAARGAVVVSPTSGWQTGAPVAGIDAALAEADTFLGGAACAVSFAVAKAGEWGAASDGVTLAGRVPNSFVRLSDASTVHATLSDDDLQRVAQTVYDLAVG